MVEKLSHMPTETIMDFPNVLLCRYILQSYKNQLHRDPNDCRIAHLSQQKQIWILPIGTCRLFKNRATDPVFLPGKRQIMWNLYVEYLFDRNGNPLHSITFPWKFSGFSYFLWQFSIKLLHFSFIKISPLNVLYTVLPSLPLFPSVSNQVWMWPGIFLTTV